MNDATTPLLSVIIPNYGRPQYLMRAIDSALQAAPDCDVEVIVVPNGPDESWRSVATEFEPERRIRWHPITSAHANVARNHGMSLAGGKYLRFLDDDDYLLPVAAKQLEFLERNSAEVCSGRVLNVDKDNADLGRLSFPDTNDFVCAATTVSAFTLPTGNIFLRRSLAGCRWDPMVNRGQDNAWMLDLAAAREWEWVHLDEDVGVWFQHDRYRTSSVAPFSDRATHLVGRLTNLHETLLRTKRHNRARLRAIADALWRYAHAGFPYNPTYWTQIARRANDIDPASRPPEAAFQTGIFRSIHPIWGEWLLLPLRKATRAVRDVRAHLQGQDYRRRL